ncbi:hypothetical protein GBK02_14765 [Dechloromonas sp. TW-R-39-2]|uniref:PglL family O-oligosaccharyltransferase n=1 Tax=Dechloromonas sp. TW-R-39-2 TaxID=2654218 RepID=UPI00193E1EE9|nr:O-antigen ligase family protein [Dechloromonas sp. TW-R-39-2]QRM20553.1 hypothetical protein GBK02_14765 [Dechloromonas sp. TW-R-39-2]
MVVSALAFSLTWLMPNHVLPWLSFHSDAWASIVLVAVAGYVFYKNNSPFPLALPVLFFVLLAFVPIGQYLIGTIYHFGSAWINFAYLLGLLCSIVLGFVWVRQGGDQCLNFLFLAIGFAALISTSMQLLQWLDGDTYRPWLLRASGRYYANMAQPNQLASLLLLGVVACSWGWAKKVLNPIVAVILCCYLFLGVALTESRSAWLGFLLLLFCTCYFRTLVGRQYLQMACFLAVVFFTGIFLFSVADSVGAGGVGEHRDLYESSRLVAWKMLLEASLKQPFFGVGWGQLAEASFLVMDAYPPLGVWFTSAHNLVIDIILWNGLGLGFIFLFFLLCFGWSAFSKVSDVASMHLLALLIVLITHGMLELPLQYAYFLFPAGIAFGGLLGKESFFACGMVSPIVLRLAWLGVVFVMLLTLRDYFVVENSFYALRFERSRIVSPVPVVEEEIYVLTQWRDYFLLAKEPVSALSKSVDDPNLREILGVIPSVLVMEKYSLVLLKRGDLANSLLWLARICKSNRPESCDLLKAEWVGKYREQN